MATIFHLTTASGLAAGLGSSYAPVGWEREGFIHCSPDEETTLAVAKSYFSNVTEPVLLLQLDTDRLTSEWRLEAPAPIAGGGGEHRTPGKLFPHVYGRIDRSAIVGVATLGRAEGRFRWPDTFDPLAP
jgi:uncharacterized protein (DUF952 family)